MIYKYTSLRQLILMSKLKKDLIIYLIVAARFLGVSLHIRKAWTFTKRTTKNVGKQFSVGKLVDISAKSGFSSLINVSSFVAKNAGKLLDYSVFS